MSKFKFIILLLFAFVATSFNSEYKSKVIMVVLAHPDDEAAVGQILARYASKKDKVFLVLACDGRYGVEDHAGIPPGDSLVQVRKKESICGCIKLGIQPPIFLGFHDGLGSADGIEEYFNQTISLKEKLKKQIEEINPDLIITFGPDGDTGHPDHRGISDITTEIILREGWYKKYPLYYIGWLKEKIVSIPQGGMTSLNYVDKKYLNVKIKYSEADRQKLFESLNCYKSQLTETDVKNWISAELKDSSFVFYFRRFITQTEQKTDF
jgi:N-acetylglucosamine malate deacetylase 2